MATRETVAFSDGKMMTSHFVLKTAGDVGMALCKVSGLLFAISVKKHVIPCLFTVAIGQELKMQKKNVEQI